MKIFFLSLERLFSLKPLNYAIALSHYRTIALSLLGCIMAVSLQSQHICGFEPVNPNPPQSNAQSNPPCYDMDFVQANCTEVFINVNVHFFLDDNCEGDMASVADPYPPNNDPGDMYEDGDFNRHNAFFLAEKLVDDANQFVKTRNLNETNENHQWNQSIHGATVTPFECIPFQFVLNGTRIHCDSDAQVNSTSENFSDFSQYTINNDTEINIFVTKITDAGGYTFLGYHSFVTQQIDHWSAPINFLHEIFHDFNLNHSFIQNDGCDDTFPSDWEFDLNQNGTISNFIDNSQEYKERGITCWNREVDSFDNMDPCDESDYPNGTHYCCIWNNMDNNMMNYSQYAAYVPQAAITPCQVSRMLDHVNTDKCDFIADVGPSCPPPSSFIGRLPEYAGTSPCKSCFYLNASHNESGYDVTVLDQQGNTYLETGYIDNKAGKFCITARQNQFDQYVWPYDLIAGQTYTMQLHVQNECGDFDDHSVDFILPTPCNSGPTPNDKMLELISISPNPATGIVTVNFNLEQAGLMKIYGKYISSSNIYNNPKIENKTQGQNQQMTFDVSNWSPGFNSVIFQFKDEIYIENIIKQ